MAKLTLKSRLFAFFFEVRSEPNTAVLQSRVMVAAMASDAVPFNFLIDWRAGSLLAITGELAFLALLVGTLIRLPLGHFPGLSIFNSPDLSSRSITVILIATLLGLAAVIDQHHLVRNLARLASSDCVSGLASWVRIEEYLRERKPPAASAKSPTESSRSW